MRTCWRRGKESMTAIIVCAALLTTSASLFPMMSTGADDEPKTLRVGVLEDTPDFNMFNPATDSTWKHTILDWAFESVAVAGYDSRVYPLLAEGWDFDEA